MKALKTVWTMVAGMTLVGVVCLAAWIQGPGLELLLTRPPHGTFYSLQNLEHPPLPFNLFPDLPLFSLGDGFYLVDDRTVDYVALRELASGGGPEKSLASDTPQKNGGPPPPPGGGGGGGGSTNPPPPVPQDGPGLKLTRPILQTDAVLLSLREADPAQAYELFVKPGLETNASWSYVIGGVVGQTNFTTPLPGFTNAFYLAAQILDSDSDGLSDAQEALVHHTNPADADSDHDGLPDGWEVSHGLNPLNSSSPNDDPDGDGYDNFEEYVLGQNPNVADPARPTLSVSVPDATATEPGTDTGRFQINRSGSVSQALTVYYRLSGTARNGTDYVLTTNQVTLAAGQSSASVTITPVDDTDFEGPETVTLELSPSLRYLYGATTSGTLTLQDNDKPTVSVFALDEEASEVGREPGEFELRRTGSLYTNLVVRFTLTGSATNTTDYDTLPTTVTFSPDVAVTNLVLRPKTDGICEGNDTAVLTLTADAAYQIRSGFGTATIWVADADKPTVSVVASDADAREASLNPGSFRFTRNGATNEALTVRFRVTGMALATVDYQPIGQTVTIPAGTNAVNVSVVPIDDTNQEACETVVATLAGGADYRVGTTNSATVYLDDNETTYFFTDLDLEAAGLPSRFSPGVAGGPGSGVDVPGEIAFYRRGSARSEKRFPYRVAYNFPDRLGDGHPGSTLHHYGRTRGRGKPRHERTGVPDERQRGDPAAPHGHHDARSGV